MESCQAVTSGIVGSLKHLMEMPEYELEFSPYIELAELCGLDSVSLKVSPETGRVYLWNVNLGGHMPRLELKPVSLDKVVDLEFMTRMHENHGYNISLEVDVTANYKI